MSVKLEWTRAGTVLLYRLLRDIEGSLCNVSHAMTGYTVYPIQWHGLLVQDRVQMMSVLLQ